MSLKSVAIQFLAMLHLLIVLFVVFGSLLKAHNVLLFHLVLLPILVLHWQTNHGVCFLTQLENKIQKRKFAKSQLQGGFTEAMFRCVFGRKPSKVLLQNLIYGIMMMSWMISLVKILI